MNTLTPNKGKEIEMLVDTTRYLRLPVQAPLIHPGDDLFALLDTYVRPHLQAGDLLFVSEKVLCITQNQLIKTSDISVSPLAALLSTCTRTTGSSGASPDAERAMQLRIEEVGVPRVLCAATIATVTRPFGMMDTFSYLVGKRAQAIACPVSCLAPFTDYAKRAPEEPERVAYELKERVGVNVIILNADDRDTFSLGKSTKEVSEKFIRALMRDNPAGQGSEMTPFVIARKM